MGPRRAWILVLLLALLTQPLAPVANASGAGADGGTPSNAWLADAPKPKGSKVSEGSEPMVLTSNAGEAVWVADTTGAYRTSDNGTTWEEVPFLLDLELLDGVSLAQDAGGTLYAAFLRSGRVEVLRPYDPGEPLGRTSRVATASAFPDRPWIAAGAEGEVVLLYYDVSTLSESCVRTTEAGLVWPDHHPAVGAANAGEIDMAEDGSVAYVPSSSQHMRILEDPCLGGPIRTEPIDPADPGAQTLTPVDHSDGAWYTAAPTGDHSDIMVFGVQGDTRRSVSVAPPVLAANTFATVSARDGEVAVAWYGSEANGDPNDPGFDGAWNVYVARIDRFWTAEPRISYSRLTESPNHFGDICRDGLGCGSGSEDRDRDLLDYFGVDHDDHGGVHVAYAHDGDGDDAEVRYAHLASPDSDTAPPVSSFHLSVDGKTVRLDGSASRDPDGEVESHMWRFGDDSPPREGDSVRHTYRQPGTYQITLTVTDDDQATDTSRTNVTVPSSETNQPPVASFEGNLTGRTLALDASSSRDPDGTVTRYEWSFGDGEMSTGPQAQHTYPGPGTYTMRLTVWDDDNRSATATDRIEASNASRSLDQAAGASSGNPDGRPTPGSPFLALAALAVARLHRGPR